MLEFIKNKHMIMAMFIAPVLAIVAYFATDHIVATPPQAIQAGQSYPLSARSNCRYESGVCTLKNGDLEIHFKAEKIDGNALTLSAQTSVKVQNVLIALSPSSQDIAPSAMNKTATEQNTWQLSIPIPASVTRDKSTPNLADQSENGLSSISLEELVLRVAVQADGATFFAETGTDFFSYQTSFSQENFSKI